MTRLVMLQKPAGTSTSTVTRTRATRLVIQRSSVVRAVAGPSASGAGCSARVNGCNVSAVGAWLVQAAHLDASCWSWAAQRGTASAYASTGHAAVTLAYRLMLSLKPVHLHFQREVTMRVLR